MGEPVRRRLIVGAAQSVPEVKPPAPKEEKKTKLTELEKLRLEFQGIMDALPASDVAFLAAAFSSDLATRESVKGEEAIFDGVRVTSMPQVKDQRPGAPARLDNETDEEWRARYEAILAPWRSLVASYDEFMEQNPHARILERDNRAAGLLTKQFIEWREVRRIQYPEVPLDEHIAFPMEDEHMSMSRYNALRRAVHLRGLLDRLDFEAELIERYWPGRKGEPAKDAHPWVLEEYRKKLASAEDRLDESIDIWTDERGIIHIVKMGKIERWQVRPGAPVRQSDKKLAGYETKQAYEKRLREWFKETKATQVVMLSNETRDKAYETLRGAGKRPERLTEEIVNKTDSSAVAAAKDASYQLRLEQWVKEARRNVEWMETHDEAGQALPGVFSEVRLSGEEYRRLKAPVMAPHEAKDRPNYIRAPKPKGVKFAPDERMRAAGIRDAIIAMRVKGTP